jgi:hypothetical protein
MNRPTAAANAASGLLQTAKLFAVQQCGSSDAALSSLEKMARESQAERRYSGGKRALLAMGLAQNYNKRQIFLWH